MISIVIPTYNRWKSLEQTLISLTDQTLPKSAFEIIVVDNNSSEDRGEEILLNLLQKFPDIQITLVKEKKPGLHNARHAGIHASKYDIIVFTDDDATLDAQCLFEYQKAFQINPEMAAAGGPVLPVWECPPPTWLTEYIGNSKEFPVLSIMNLGNTFLLSNRGIFYGVNMAIRKQVAIDVGGFNPESFGDTWLGDGETGLMKKLWHRNMLIGYVPEAIVYHHIPESRMTLNYFCHRYSNEGACRAYSRYHDRIPSRFVLLLHILYLLIKKSPHLIRSSFNSQQTTPSAINSLTTACMTRTEIGYIARLLTDQGLRQLVVQKDWLK